MTDAKKYCLTHNATAVHHAVLVQLHGIEYGADGEFAFISERVYSDPFGHTVFKFHRCLIRYYADGTPYIRVYSKHYDGKRQSKIYSLADFIRIGVWGNIPYFTADELAA